MKPSIAHECDDGILAFECADNAIGMGRKCEADRRRIQLYLEQSIAKVSDSDFVAFLLHV